MALAERAVREGCPGNHEHPKEPGEKSPTERRLSQKIGGKRHKKTIFSFSTFAQDWHSGVFRAKTKSYSTDRGLGNWERKGERYRNPTARCLMLIYLLFSLFTPSLTLEKMNYVYMMCCVNISALTNF